MLYSFSFFIFIVSFIILLVIFFLESFKILSQSFRSLKVILLGCSLYLVSEYMPINEETMIAFFLILLFFFLYFTLRSTLSVFFYSKQFFTYFFFNFLYLSIELLSEKLESSITFVSDILVSYPIAFRQFLLLLPQKLSNFFYILFFKHLSIILEFFSLNIFSSVNSLNNLYLTFASYRPLSKSLCR